MRNLKKILSLALALVMVLSMMVTASAAFEDQDLINEKYAEAVEVMSTIGILQGDGTNYNPAGTLTRAEAAVILSKVISGKSDVKVFEAATKYTENPFTDVPAWAVPYVLYCYQNGVVGGRTATTFDAKGTITGYEFAKMLLVAAGQGTHEDYVGDANKTWQVKVVEAAQKADVQLLAGLTVTLKNPINREQAAQMALNAMKVGASVSFTYDVIYNEDANAAEDDDGWAVAKKGYTSAIDAALYAAELKAALGWATDVKTNKVVTASLLDNYSVTYQADSADHYGRDADIYTLKNGKQLAFNTPAPIATYTNAATAKDVAADLEGYSAYAVSKDVETLKGVEIWTDGVKATSTDVVNPVAKAIAALTDANAVVEVYANEDDEIVKIVVINTYFGKVATSKNAKGEEFISLPFINTVKNTFGVKKGDVVAYTKYGKTLDTATALEGFEGKVSSYVNVGYKSYYINGASYVLDKDLLEDEDTNWATKVEGTILPTADAVIFYFGANGTIAYVDDIDTEDPEIVVNNTFAQVLRTAYTVTAKTEGVLLGDATTSYTTEALVELLLTDGKTVKVPVALNIAAKNNTLGLAEGTLYYYIGKTLVNLGPVASNVTEDGQVKTLTALEGKLVAYDDGVITYAKAESALEDEINDNVYTVSVDTVTAASPVAGDDIVFNSNTVFVIGKYNAKGEPVGYQTVKGLAALGTTTVNPDFVVYAAVWNEKDEQHDKVALYVFDKDCKLVSAQVDTSTDVYVFNTMVYGVSVNEKGKLVYTVSVMKADGTFLPVEMTEKEYTDSQLGVYELLSTGKLGAVEGETGSGYVEQIVENYIYINGEWEQLSAKATVAGTIEVESGIYWLDADKDGLIDYVWVVS